MRIPAIQNAALRPVAVAPTAAGRWWLQCRARWRRRQSRWVAESGEVLKRALDIAGSLAFLILFSPLFAVLAVLIRLDTRGPIIFSQARVGRFSREFQMFKFRSMHANAEAQLQQLLPLNVHKDGVTFKLRDDPRITRVGKWMRRFSLDELPQFFNVLKGDMSLVGPRPPTPREVARYTLYDRRRLAAKPGITCLWQVRGRSEIDFSGQVKLDVEYIESAGFWVDVNILLKTVPAVISGKGAC